MYKLLRCTKKSRKPKPITNYGEDEKFVKEQYLFPSYPLKNYRSKWV